MKQLRITILALASVGWAIAQDVPPLEPLRGDAASLKDTMKFIQDKVHGNVNYVVYGHNNRTGGDVSQMRRFEISNVSSDATRCSITFQEYFDNGIKGDIKDYELLLKPVQNVVLQQMDQTLQQDSAKNGHPEMSIKVEPSIFLVVLYWEPKHRMMFNFYDDTLADRGTKAFQHAVDLCGGGNKDPF